MSQERFDEGFTKQEVKLNRSATNDYLRNLILDGGLEETSHGEAHASILQTSFSVSE